MMLNDHSLELINRALDGEITGSERAELETLLEQSEEARLYHQELIGLNDLLAAVPAVEPPQALKDRIYTQILLPRPRRWFTWSAAWMQGNPVTYGIAAAAGLLAAVGYYELAPGARGVTDYSSLVGTLARGNGVNGIVELSFLDIDIPSVQGKVVLSGGEDLKLLRFDVESRAPVEFEVGLGGSGYTFGGFAQEDDHGAQDLGYSGGRFRVSNSGPQRFTVILRDDSASPAVSSGIVVSVTQGGEAVYQGVLSL